MNINEKGKAINTFTNDPDCRIFLMSLKAGGVALNLTVASHVSLEELHPFFLLLPSNNS
jgi:DNA repair protein RAD16